MSVIEWIAPATYEETQEAIHSGARLLPFGGGTKPALSTPPEGYLPLSTRGLTGIVEYEASEFTITARAGTPLREIVAALEEHGQYLPWDPPLVEAGATLGGAIAAGLSGSGRYRYGGLRDFLVGIRFVDGQGRLVRGGGKVVKNAAGFDLPKLFIGTMGRLGVLVEATFKVFPKPPAWATLRLPVANLRTARTLIERLGQAPLDLNALDLAVDGASEATLWLRIGGMASALAERIERLRAFVGGGEIVREVEEPAYWQSAAAFSWIDLDAPLIYATLLPDNLELLDALLVRREAERRYLVGANIAHIALKPGDSLRGLSDDLRRVRASGIVIRGESPALLGMAHGDALLRRVKGVLDPNGVFPPFERI